MRRITFASAGVGSPASRDARARLTNPLLRSSAPNATSTEARGTIRPRFWRSRGTVRT